MAEVIKTQFQLRRGKKATWETKNPILAKGEPGFETDTFGLKIGDGITPWIELPYISKGQISIDSLYQEEGTFVTFYGGSATDLI
jgi:hypothetical protein